MHLGTPAFPLPCLTSCLRGTPFANSRSAGSYVPAIKPTMPSLSSLFQKLATSIPGESSHRGASNYASEQAPSDPSSSTSHFLSTPLPLTLSPHPATRSIPPPSQAPIPISPQSLLFSLTFPHDSEPTGFFFHCLPDPIGFLHHCVPQIMSYLSPTFPNAPRYRNQSLSLVLDPSYDGLACTSGGKIQVSVKWISNVQQSVAQGREIEDATKEFKGVLLHELTHALQHDGYGSTPSWFTESIADWIRLGNGLGPKHWKRCGEGKRDKGWETGYDVGAWFFDYLVGDGTVGGLDWVPSNTGPPAPTKTRANFDGGTAQQPLPTAYTAPPPGHRPPYPKPINTKPRPRPPMPDLIRQMDARLEFERYDERWWVEMAGAPLQVLWTEYLDYYA